jgi:hypothetical protein
VKETTFDGEKKGFQRIGGGGKRRKSLVERENYN